jgi:hypothetical protein
MSRLEYPPTEALPIALRRAARGLLAERPALGLLGTAMSCSPVPANASELQAAYLERFGLPVARRMGADLAGNPSPELFTRALFAAAHIAWAAWTTDMSSDLSHLVDRVHDALDDGFAAGPVDS